MRIPNPRVGGFDWAVYCALRVDGVGHRGHPQSKPWEISAVKLRLLSKKKDEQPWKQNHSMRGCWCGC